MSHYGFVKDRRGRSRRLHRSLFILSMTGALLAGCERRSEPLSAPDLTVQTVAKGFDAYVAGDQAGLDKDVQDLASRLPADESGEAFISCSSSGYGLRRLERAR